MLSLALLYLIALAVPVKVQQLVTADNATADTNHVNHTIADQNQTNSVDLVNKQGSIDVGGGIGDILPLPGQTTKKPSTIFGESTTGEYNYDYNDYTTGSDYESSMSTVFFASTTENYDYYNYGTDYDYSTPRTTGSGVSIFQPI